MEIKKGIGEGGCDLEGCKSAGFPAAVFSLSLFFFLLPPLLFPFVGNKHISKDELCLSLVNVLHILEDGAAIMMCDVYIRLLDTRIPPFEILLTSKYLN